MGRIAENDSTFLPIKNSIDAPPKFPLGFFPASIRPFVELIRVEKPTGMILMFWPFAWGLTMAAFRLHLPLQAYAIDLLKCLVGAFILRSSACTVNDIMDRNMDAGVERTHDRPLPGGRLSVRSAVVFLFVQYAIGIVFFWFAVRGIAFWVALFQLLPLFAIYPLLKRITHWPQAWLGIAMNFGLISAWTASTGNLDAAVLASALSACWCWTMLYGWFLPFICNHDSQLLADTIYACQDIKDDVNMGVRSTAILFGEWIRPLLVGCGLAFVTLLAISGYLNGQRCAFFVVSVGGTALHLLWQYSTVDLDIPKSCWKNFKRNGQLGWIVWAGLMIDYLQLIHPL